MNETNSFSLANFCFFFRFAISLNQYNQYPPPFLLEITKKLDIKHDKKITVTRLCRKIERHLRAKQLEADKNKTGERWMYDTYETQ